MEYQSNSHKAKEESRESGQIPIPEKKVEKVVSGPVVAKKRSEAARLAEVFISEDVGNIKSYLFSKIFVPAIKRAVSDTVSTISDVVTSGVNTILFGESGRNLNISNRSSQIPYGSYFNSQNLNRVVDTRINQNQGQPMPLVRTGYNYKDIIVSSRGEAEAVLFQMDEILSTYGMVRVADLYELAGVSGDYTDNDYGWMDLRSSEAVRVNGGGYLIRMPRALPLKK